MSKNVIVGGKTYNGISTVALALAAGGTALFRDADEASGGSTPGIVEIATGKFSVSKAETDYIIRHGMSVAPDLVAVIPKYWHDTVNNQFAISVKSRYAHAAGGRREIGSSTLATQFVGAIMDGTTDFSEEVTVSGATLAKFQPTWTDADGSTGTQEYLWVAVKFAE